jgi:hypothetical protein
MIEDAEYHEQREAQERAIASSLPEGEARERHLTLADQHADRAWLIRNNHLDEAAELPPQGLRTHRGVDYSLSKAIKQSRQLIATSNRLLSQSRKDAPPVV